MFDALTLVVLIVAAWRASSLLVYESGPWGVFSWLRDFVGVKYDDFSMPYGTWLLPKIFSCIDCMSVWVGLLFAGMYFVVPILTLVVAAGLLLSMASIVIDRLR